MADLSSDIERLRWRPTHFHPLAEDGGAVRSALLSAAEQCDAARASDDLTLMHRALSRALAEPYSLRSSQAALTATLDTAALRAYEAAVDEAAVAYDRALEALVAEVGRRLLSAGPQVAEDLGLLPLYQRATRTRLHARSARQDAQHATLRHLTLTSTARILDALARDERLGTIEVDGATHELERGNLSSLLAHRDARVRRSVAESIRANARRTRSVHEVIKVTRLQAIHELCALRGFASPFEEYLATSGMTLGAIAAQHAMEGRLLELCRRHAEYKRASFGLDDLEECDLEAMSSPAPRDLSLRRVLTALERRLGVYDDRYPAWLQQTFTCGTILTDSSAALARSYFVIASAHGGPPLVHAPYVRDLQGFAATAHELGHACQLGADARDLGPLAVYDPPMAFSEVFSLLTEVIAVMAARDESAPHERRFWCEAIVDQFLYFMRRLGAQARFDERALSTRAVDIETLEVSRVAALRRLTPTSVVVRRDDSWLRNPFQEELPYCGYSYCGALLVAYRLALRPVPLRAFSEDGWHQDLEHACRATLGIDIARVGDFDVVWEFVESAMTELEWHARRAE
jgi:oligoendopeptidase F